MPVFTLTVLLPRHLDEDGEQFQITYMEELLTMLENFLSAVSFTVSFLHYYLTQRKTP